MCLLINSKSTGWPCNHEWCSIRLTGSALMGGVFGESTGGVGMLRPHQNPANHRMCFSQAYKTWHSAQPKAGRCLVKLWAWSQPAWTGITEPLQQVSSLLATLPALFGGFHIMGLWRRLAELILAKHVVLWLAHVESKWVSISPVLFLRLLRDRGVSGKASSCVWTPPCCYQHQVLERRPGPPRVWGGNKPARGLEEMSCRKLLT